MDPIQQAENLPPVPEGRDHELHVRIPQPLTADAKAELRGNVHVHIDIPPEARRLMEDLHEDRAAIGIGCMVVIMLLATAVLKYFVDWRRR